MRRSRFAALAALMLVFVAGPARGYVDISPSLGWLVGDATQIVLLEVDKVSLDRKVVVYKKVADLKGASPDGPTRHHVAEGFHPREPRTVLEWAEPGRRAIAFVNGPGAVVCIGEYWYQVAAREDGWWAMTTGRPELALAYHGSVERLRFAVDEMLAGREAVVTAVNHGARTGVYQYGNVAYHKVLRGKDCPVWRLRVSLKMPDRVWLVGAKDSAWIVGPGAAGPDEIPGIVKELRHADARRRAEAAERLGLVGWKARAALPELNVARNDADPAVRIHAARAIGYIGEENPAAMQTLIDAFGEGEPSVRKAAAAALGDLGAAAKAAVPVLRQSLRAGDPSVRWAAAEALGRIGFEARSAAPDLADALRDPVLRVIAADALGGIGPPARGACPLLVEALRDPDRELQSTAAIALTRIDPIFAKEALPIFIEKLRSSDLRMRWDAMMYVQPMGLEAKAAAEPVEAMVKRGNGIAAQTLAAIAGPDAIEALPVLLYVLDEDWDTCANIAQIGPAALPLTLKQFEDRTAKSRPLIAKALGLLAQQTKDAVGPLVKGLKDSDPAVRRASATALEAVEARYPQTWLPLTYAMNDPDASVRLAAALTLRFHPGPERDRAVTALVGLVASKEPPELRRRAASALADFGADARSALGPLEDARDDPDAGVRSAAAWSYARVAAAQANREAVAILCAALKTGDDATKRDAVRRLPIVGADSAQAREAVQAARLDDDPEVRTLAADALLKWPTKK